MFIGRYFSRHKSRRYRLKIILTLLKKEYMTLRKHFLSLLCVIISFPLFMYLFIVLPLSRVILDIKPIYINWSAAGVWTITCLFLVYLYSFHVYKKTYENESILILPVPSYYLLISNYLTFILFGIIEISISIILIGALTHDYVGFLNYILILLLIIPSIIIVGSISLFFYFFIKNHLVLSLINTIYFSIIIFGYGAFIPLKYFPQTYLSYIHYLPIPGMIENFQNIISGGSIMFSSLILAFFFSLLMLVLSFLILDKKMIKNI